MYDGVKDVLPQKKDGVFVISFEEAWIESVDSQLGYEENYLTISYLQYTYLVIIPERPARRARLRLLDGKGFFSE